MSESTDRLERLPRDPEIYAVVELPESEKGGQCTYYPGEDPERCEGTIEYVVVHEANLDRDDDRRRNHRVCADCTPRVTVDGGTVSDEADPRTVEVVWAGNSLERDEAILHRREVAKACRYRPVADTHTDLVTADVGDHAHELCPDCEWPDGAEDVLGPDESELVDELLGLEEEDRVDVAIAGAGRPMALVVDVDDRDGDGRSIRMRTLADRTIDVSLLVPSDGGDGELVGATITGEGNAETEPIEIAGVHETAQQTLDAAMANVEDPEEEWPPETLDLYCKRCGEVHEHERTTSEKTGRTAWKCPEHNLLNDPEQPRLGVAFSGGDGE